jgi:hypothetical protein
LIEHGGHIGLQAKILREGGDAGGDGGVPLRMIAAGLAVAGKENALDGNGHRPELGAEDEGFRFGGLGGFYFHAFRLLREPMERNKIFRAAERFLEHFPCQAGCHTAYGLPYLVWLAHFLLVALPVPGRCHIAYG